jgi:purine-binding chemotaxis protein CheW
MSSKHDTTQTTRNAPQAKDSGHPRGGGGKYLTFALGREGYGLEILKVREIIGFMDITAVPRTPGYVKGVINLRGQVISVVDLRTKFGMEPADKTDETCIIVVDISQPNGRKLNTGIIVDKVSEVLNIAAENIEPPPSFGASVDHQFILGMGKTGSSVKILLDIDKVLGGSEVSELAAFQQSQQAKAAAA